MRDRRTIRSRRAPLGFVAHVDTAGHGRRVGARRKPCIRHKVLLADRFLLRRAPQRRGLRWRTAPHRAKTKIHRGGFGRPSEEAAPLRRDRNGNAKGDEGQAVRDDAAPPVLHLQGQKGESETETENDGAEAKRFDDRDFAEQDEEESAIAITVAPCGAVCRRRTIAPSASWERASGLGSVTGTSVHRHPPGSTPLLMASRQPHSRVVVARGAGGRCGLAAPGTARASPLR